MFEIKEYITKNEFCKRLGITGTNLYVAIRRGRVLVEKYNGKPRIEWHENRRRFIETARIHQRYTKDAINKRIGNNGSENGKENPRSNLKQDSYADSNKFYHPTDLIQDPIDKDGDFLPQMSKLQAEAVKQVYFAKQAKIKFLKDAGILIETAIVQKEWEEIAMRVQKTMMSIPDRVAEMFASINDAEKIHRDLTSEISHALSSLQYKVNIEEKDDRIEELIDENGKDPQEE